MCSNQKEIGEINTIEIQNMENKIISEEEILKIHPKRESSITNYDVDKILFEMYGTDEDMEPPPEIMSQNLENNKSIKLENIQYNNGDTYKGTINQNNKKEGYGTYSNKNNYIYKGIWKNDKIGDYGIFIDPEGNYFKGTLINGEVAHGEMLLKNKWKYVGDFKNNLPHNKGILFHFEDKYIYEGDFIDGIKEGKGIIKYSNGTLYEGGFKDDKYDGQGKIIINNGGTYEGEFKNNIINGKGKYMYSDGKIYEGDFQNGLKHGYGKISWNENKYFEGYWINNKQHGEGKYYLNGKILKSIFRYGKMIMKIK